MDGLNKFIMGNHIVVDAEDDKESHLTSSTRWSEYRTDVDPTMTAAAQVVREVMEQTTWKDFPPMASEPGGQIDPVLSPSGLVQQQQPSKPTLSSHASVTLSQFGDGQTFIAGASSFETTESSLDNGTSNRHHDMVILEGGPAHHFPSDHPVSKYRQIFHDRYQKQNKLGQGPLDALCEWTLDVFEVDKPEGLRVQTQEGGEGHTTLPVPTSSSVSNNKRNWRRSFSKAQSPKSDIGSPKALKIQPSQPTVRLQMFGSEYARHLTGSSRTETKKKRRKAQPRKILGRPLFLDEANPAAQTGAILDIIVTPNDQPPPNGYYRLRHGEVPFQNCRGKNVWHMDVKKEPNWEKAAQRPCITALTIIFPDRNEFIPPGFSVVRDGKSRQTTEDGGGGGGKPADIGTAERVYLCYRRSREGNPLTGILPLSPADGDSVPDGYTVVERTPRNFVADLNQGASRKPLFVAIRQRLTNLEALRPLPFVLTVKQTLAALPDSDQLYHQGIQKHASVASVGHNLELQGYYATSGSVVSSNVGKFHVLDRSTHSLLSPSSVSNRLNLIEKSRIKAGKAPLGGNGNAIQPGSYSLVKHKTLSEFEARDAAEIRREREIYALPQSIFPEDDSDFRRLLDAVDFIPAVEVAAKNEARGAALLRLQARTTLLVPILTACYNRHGGGALASVEGLHRLLATTDFFEDDVDLSDESDHESCSRFTLLDLSVQVVCDIASSGALETTFGACVEFVEEAVQYSHAQLNTRTMGYVVRFYFFCFYFGASSPTLSADWPGSCWQTPSQHESIGDFSLLNDPRGEDETCPYLPGGAPQTAAIAFKDLISLSIIRLGKVAVKSSVVKAFYQEENIGKENAKPSLGALIDEVLSGVIGNAVDNVERANLAQIALHQVHRSGGSELFWHDMINVCGNGLFGKDPDLSDAAKGVYVTIFALLANVVKVASGKVRTSETGLLPRDKSAKNLALELLLHFIEYWSDEQEAVVGMEISSTTHSGRSVSTDTMAFAVRRMVLPCMLGNTRAAILDKSIFRRMLSIVSELWRSPVNRSHCRAELGILIDHFLVHFLQLGPQLLPESRFALESDGLSVSLHWHQLDIIRELKALFTSAPQDVLLMFLNYDTDIGSKSAGSLQPMPGTRWKLLQRLFCALASIAEGCGEAIAQQIEEHRAQLDADDETGTNEQSGAVSNANKSALRESARRLRTASFECIAAMVRAIAISTGASCGRAFASLYFEWGDIDSPPNQKPKLLTYGEQQGDRILTIINEKENQIVPYVSGEKPHSEKTNSQQLEVAVGIASKRGLKRAIDYLVASGGLSAAPRSIATFLRMHKNRFDSTELGRYLGETGIDTVEKEYWNSLRHSFFRSISFLGMTLDDALRHFLTHCGFRLPGEAQKVDRIINTFAECFFEDNAGDASLCPFPTEDEVYLLSFAVILLNTDLHKASKKRGKKMNKVDFVANIRGSQQGENIPKDYLHQLYDSIQRHPIVLDDMQELDLAVDAKRDLADILNNAQGADSLLRGLAVHDFHFLSIEELAASSNCSVEASTKELAQSVTEKTWHFWHSVISSCLETAHLDLQGMESCTEILLYALSIAVSLELPTEREALLSQLGRLKSFEELRQGKWVQAPDYEAFKQQDWYLELEEACSSNNAERRVWALRNIREWMTSVKTDLLDTVKNKADLTKAIGELQNGDVFLQDPARSFVRSGKLTKRSGRTGRSYTYSFFLFSDLLLYASSKAGEEKMKIHEELSLHQLTLTEFFPETQKNREKMFELHHPRKRFVVVCSSVEEKKSWVDDIKKSILDEVDRKVKMEAARLSVHMKAKE